VCRARIIHPSIVSNENEPELIGSIGYDAEVARVIAAPSSTSAVFRRDRRGHGVKIV
jgi:hypothetical protein